jgi:small redox-active disulfide protein 2
MKKLQILGTGCPKCKMLAQLTVQAAQGLGIKYEIQKVTDLNEIMKFGVMITPALAIDGEIKIMGKVPSIQDIKEILMQ